MLNLSFPPSRATCAALGRKGFEATTQKYFCGVRLAHTNWLSHNAVARYAAGSGVPSASLKFSLTIVIHPVTYSSIARFVLWVCLRSGSVSVALEHFKAKRITYDEYLSIQVCVLGRIDDEIPF